jgi:hypothetical protein
VAGAPDCPVSQWEQRLPGANSRLPKVNNDEQYASELRVEKPERVALDCPVQLQDKGSNGQLAPNPNGCADVAHTGQ